MRLHFVVISVFDPNRSGDAKLGPKDANRAHQSVAATLRMAGVNVGKEQDPMWYLMTGDKFVGYVKVFREERYARNWLRDLKERETSRNFWAFWRDGHPLALIESANAKDANQFVNYQALCRVRAFSAQSAAENGWTNWKAGKLTAIEVDLENSRGGTTVEKAKGDTAIERSPRQNTVKCGEWQISRGNSDINGPRPSEELSRTYELSGLAPPNTTATLRIVCKLESEGLEGGLEGEKGGLRLYRQLRFYLHPFRLPHDVEFVLSRDALYRLVTFIAIDHGFLRFRRPANVIISHPVLRIWVGNRVGIFALVRVSKTEAAYRRRSVPRQVPRINGCLGHVPQRPS